MSGFKYTLSSVNVYFASYFYFKGENINTRDTYFFMPCIDLLICLCQTPGAKFGKKIGTTSIISLMIIFHFTSFIILIFASRFYLVILSLCLLGIGSGFSQLTYTRNAWKYFPNNQGLAYGIIISSSGIFSTFFTILADFFVINPKREETINGIYPQYVADNVEKYIYIIIIIFFFIDIFGLLLTFGYDKIPETEEEKIKKINEKKTKYIKKTNDINESTNSNLQITNIINKDELQLKKVFFSKINLKFFIFCFCGFCKLFFILILYL